MLKAYPVPGKAKSAMLCQAFIDGAPKSAQGSVWYGVKAGNFEDWKRVRASGEDWYFIDNSYFDSVRGVQFRVAKNRLQHDGFGESDGRRFAALGIEIKPWRSGGPDDRIVVVEQSLDHMRYVIGDEGWFDRIVKALSAHRLCLRRWSADKPKLQSTLAEDLAGAQGLVTHTSAAAITACLAGVRVLCAQECAATYGGSDDMADRLRWAGALADAQWTIEEMKQGLAWRTLNP